MASASPATSSKKTPSSSPETSSGAPFSVLRKAPAPSKFSSARPIGSVIRWQPAQEGLELCTARRSRAVRAFSASSSLEKSTFGGGSGTCWHSSSSRIALPRCVGELRTAWELAARKLTCVMMPRRGLSGGNSCALQPLRAGVRYTAASGMDMKVLRVVNRSR